MRAFAGLCAMLDSAASHDARLRAWRRYLAQAAPRDAAWALHLLLGHTPRRMATSADLRAAARDCALDDWLLEACLQRSGDLAETLALVLPLPQRPLELGLAEWMEEHWPSLQGTAPAHRPDRWRAWLLELAPQSRWVVLRLLSGGWRPAMAATTLQDGLAAHADLSRAVVAQRLLSWADSKHTPDARSFLALLAPMHSPDRTAGEPYPPALASTLAGLSPALGPIDDWLVSWRFDAVPAQLVRRRGNSWLWLEGPELVNDRLPDLVSASAWLPDGTVIEGSLQVLSDLGPTDAGPLRALLRRRPGARPRQGGLRLRWLAHDLLEWRGEDLRAMDFDQRRDRLTSLWSDASRPAEFVLDEPLMPGHWDALAGWHAAGRASSARGMVLRRRRRVPGDPDAAADLWHWPLPPMRIQGVLIHAQVGPGGAAGQLVSCSLALWSRLPKDANEAAAALDAGPLDEGADVDRLHLVPFAKIDAGQDHDQNAALADCVRATTVDRSGPVRILRPSLVCTVAFDHLQTSGRHRCGIALLGARIECLQPDRPIADAGHLAELRAHLVAPVVQEPVDPGKPG